MRTLYLLRHAKSSWDDARMSDHERPLNARGRRACDTLAAHLSERGIAPDLVLCSSARRTQETLERIEAALGGAEVAVEDALYGAGSSELLERVHGLPDAVEEVLVIGHNPGLHALALDLARPAPARDALAAGLPTGALVTLAFDGPGWATLAHGSAELAAFVRPRDLERA